MKQVILYAGGELPRITIDKVKGIIEDSEAPHEELKKIAGYHRIQRDPDKIIIYFTHATQTANLYVIPVRRISWREKADEKSQACGY